MLHVSPLPAEVRFRDDNPYQPAFSEAIHRLSAAFAKDDGDKAPLMDEARAVLRDFTPAGCRTVFGLGSRYSLAKEFYYETICCNAAVVARLLEQGGRAGEAKAFLLKLYHEIGAAGFPRAREFFANRLDSRTFMPLRRHIDADYLRAVGIEHPDRVLLCVGDCQTMITAEMVRDRLALPGIDIASYQHGLGSLIASPLETLLQPAGYLYFVNAAANYGIFAKDDSQREANLESMREIVRWLQGRAPRRSVFVTHVFFGVENAVEKQGVPRAVAMDAVTAFSDEVAEILSQAPNARLIDFRRLCPFTLDRRVFRDNPTSHNLLHFRFETMAKVADAVAAELEGLA
ncbi:MAG: hypothetical protein BWZ02_00947 [Lentisphaerae bacterium ADurb.BinA184]|nr:MAG: hypothetical protein BWZ02_00947 [Lentisphaerae bacterium ADurb.BinA184]